MQDMLSPSVDPYAHQHASETRDDALLESARHRLRRGQGFDVPPHQSALAVIYGLVYIYAHISLPLSYG